jgi:hypothetical protein
MTGYFEADADIRARETCDYVTNNLIQYYVMALLKAVMCD